MAALVFSSAGCAADAPIRSPLPSPGTSTVSIPAPISDPNPVATDAASPGPSPDATEVLFTVATRGGRCVGGECGTTVVVDRDGRVHFAARPPNELGMLSAELLAELDEQIRTTDFTELVSHRFTGECPTAYDGQEIVFEFATPDGVQRIASCEVEVDYESPLFAPVADAVGAFMPLPIN